MTKVESDPQIITSIVDTAGTRYFDNKNINNIFREFYSQLYKSHHPPGASVEMEPFLSQIILPTISEAQNYLMYTAKRNTSIKSVSDLPSTKSDLLSFISDERIREFFGEGHRFYDARRMGDIVSGDQFSNWDIQKFVFPIPAAEIHTGTGCAQNENWSDYLPSSVK